MRNRTQRPPASTKMLRVGALRNAVRNFIGEKVLSLVHVVVVVAVVVVVVVLFVKKLLLVFVH